ncbi:MAG TPA: hypothetical protein VGO62_19735 [Myxococcota bacterium]
MKASDFPERTTAIFTGSVLTEIRKLSHASVISLDEVKQMLRFEADKQTLGCSEGSSCLSEIADALGADALVVGTVARSDGQTALTLKRIDSKTGSVAATFDKRLVDANGDELLAAVGPAVEALFPDLPLRPGNKRGVDPEVALRLNPPPVGRLAFAGVAAATTVAALSAAGLGFAWAASQSDYTSYAKQSSAREIDGAALVGKGHSLVDVSDATYIALGVAGVGVLVTGALVPLTDWSGAGEAQ